MAYSANNITFTAYDSSPTKEHGMLVKMCLMLNISDIF